MLAAPHSDRVHLIPGYRLWRTMVLSSLYVGRAYDEVHDS
jgi:hypothetical protein